MLSDGKMICRSEPTHQTRIYLLLLIHSLIDLPDLPINRGQFSLMVQKPFFQG